MKVGIVVGRFQVSDLHSGHLALLTKANEENERLVVFLGISRSPPSEREPLDFRTREIMIHESFPSATVMPLIDNESNLSWSRMIDNLTHSAFPETEGTIYGGRDSCLDFYLGNFEKKTIENIDLGSGTESRELDSRIYSYTPEFRHGSIHAINRLGDRSIMATDVALIRDDTVLLGRKDGETLWRFPGGKLDITDGSLEGCSRRELQEEAGIFAEHMQYVASFRVNDWRFTMNPNVKIFTALYVAREMTQQTPKAGDDLVEVRWFLLSDLLTYIRPGHKELAVALLNHLKG